MLQRIQSVYLLFAALLIFALFLFPLTHNVYVNGVSSTIKVTGVYQDVNGHENQVTPFTALTMVTPVVGLIPFVIIFLYKNRKQQIALCYSGILVIIGYSFWLSQTIKDATGGLELHTDNIGVGIFLSSISIVMLILAAKSIQKDDKLVRSADRLR